MRRKLGVDIRDYSIAKTGILTVLDEIVKGFQNDGEFELIPLRPARVVRGESAIMKTLGHLDYFIWKQIRLPILARRQNCDFILCNDYVSPYYSFGIESIPIFHGLNFWEQPQNYNSAWRKLFTWMAELGAMRAKKILTVSGFTRDRLISTLNIQRNKVFVLPLGAKTRELYQNQRSENDILRRLNLDGDEYLLHVGVLEKRKNLVALVRAFSKLNNQDVKLVLAGPKGPKRDMDDSQSILEQVKMLKLEKRVHLTGFLSDDELQTLYQNAHACVLPSLYEGFGIPALEAFRYRVPLISSNAGALPEVVGDDGIYFDPMDEEDLSQKMSLVMTNQLIRERLVSNGIERLKLYNWEKCILTLKKILTDD